MSGRYEDNIFECFFIKICINYTAHRFLRFFWNSKTLNLRGLNENYVCPRRILHGTSRLVRNNARRCKVRRGGVYNASISSLVRPDTYIMSSMDMFFSFIFLAVSMAFSFSPSARPSAKNVSRFLFIMLLYVISASRS